jgi:protein SCO1/2
MLFSLCVALAAAAACATKPDQRVFTLQGQVLSVQPARKLAEIKHEEIKGFMPAMTMPYEVRDARLLDGLAPGDLISAKLIVQSNGAYLDEIRKVGSAPLETPPAAAGIPPAAGPPAAASSGFELLAPGEKVPDGHFVDENGRKRDFTSFAGRAVVVTFIYTKCPLPTFCPLMDRHFAALQKQLKTDPSLAGLHGRVHLVSVSFDPATDTPAVLKTHAATVGADPRMWTFLTGDRDDIDRFGSRFGVQVARAMADQRDITHNLRTAVIDAHGNLVKIYAGNEWTPDQVLSDLKSVG